MLYHQIAAIALAVGGWGTDATHHEALYSVQQQERFGVEFRQPDWRDHVFGSSQEMDEFIADKQRNGWELQVFPREFRVRYRLMHWGGSRMFDNLPEAQGWAAYLEREFGYEVRVVKS